MNEIQQTEARHPGWEAEPSERALTAQDLVRLFRRHLWLVLLILAVSVVTAAMISKRTPKAWRADAKMLLVQRAPALSLNPQAPAEAPMVESIDTQISLLQSRSLAQAAARQVGISPETLQQATSVSPQKDGDNVIDLTVEADSRQHAVDWANALCQSFVQYKKSVAQHNGQETLATLRGQEAQAKTQRAVADEQLLAFEQRHHLNGIGLLDTAAQKTAALNAVLAQDTVVANLQNEYVTAQARASSLEAQLRQADQAIKSGTGVRDDNAVIKLQEDMQDQERARFQMAQKYKAKYPDRRLPLLDAQIADTRARLNRAIQTLKSQPSLQAQGALRDALDTARTDANSSRVKLAAAIQQRGTLRRETTGLPQISMEAEKLTQSADQAHSLDNSLSAAVRAAQLDQDVASGNVQIVQPAFAPESPFRPVRRQDLMVGGLVGVFLSLIAVLVREQSDRRIRTVADFRRRAGGRVVAALPQMTRAQRVRFLRGETPPQMIETYNAARAALSLASPGFGVGMDGRQVIVVSSTFGGEGKSLTASELARSYARAGKQVVLVDADMRRRSSLPLLTTAQDAVPGQEASLGLAEVLSGKAAVPEVLVVTETENLLLLPSGNTDRNPIDLLSQRQISETIQALREVAEVVIIDTPPAAVVADALLLAPHADCLLYVVALGMADADTIQITAAEMAAAAPKKLSYFINRAPQSAAAPSYYHDYYRPEAAGSVPKGSSDYSPWRTQTLNRAFLPKFAPSPKPDAPLPTVPAGSGAHDQAHDQDEARSVGSRSSIRVLPEVGSHLVALEGPYVGQRFALSPLKPLALGILPDNDIVLARDQTISRNHAVITPEPGDRYVIADDRSTNGTLVNDVPVMQQALRVGDVIQLGASKFRYE